RSATLDRIWKVPRSVATSARPRVRREMTSAFTFVPAASSVKAMGGLGTVTTGAGGAVGMGSGVGGGGRIVDIDLFQQAVHDRDDIDGRFGVRKTHQDRS